MLELIDSHCHLQMENFDRDREEVIRRALASGVSEIIVSGFDSISNFKALELNSKRNLHVTLGLSPNMRRNENLEFIKSQIIENAKRIVAVGEIGLDRVKSRLPFNKQKGIFKEFLELAREINKPVVIHAREAELEAIEIARRYDVECMLHCFNGSLKALKAAQDSGCVISISTMIVFSEKQKRIAREANVEDLVIETDSPFLSPRRGRNEPAYVRYALEEISKIKEIEEEELASVLTANSRKFYRLECPDTLG
ncbi:TatD family deoxyribonuclease [Archaeoglobales archaeon]|nr:MAG: TatD family deoxyribonuclease [Archaeoglobales archaeon]